MKNILLSTFVFALFICSCSNETPQKAAEQAKQDSIDNTTVEEQLKADQAAMDSLEKAIQMQIDSSINDYSWHKPKNKFS